MATAIVNIGSNQGQRRLNLSRAVVAIERRFGSFEASHVVETSPWGYESPHKFLNMCLVFSTDLEPEALLKELLEIERSISPASHRDSDGGYADRVIDIDLVAVGDRVVNSATLTLPHPHLAERRFFLEPLQEVAPGWKHPVTGKSPAEMLAELPKSEEDE